MKLNSKWIVRSMKLRRIIETLVKFFLLAGILMNGFLVLAFILFGEKMNSQWLYLAIYGVFYLILPALLVVLFWILTSMFEDGFSKMISKLKTEFILSFLAIFTTLGVIITTQYCLD